MELALCIGVSVLIALNIIVSMSMRHSVSKFLILFTIVISTLILTSICMTYNSISPIEVYRGNTKLVITDKVVNGEVIERDSTVVLK